MHFGTSSVAVVRRETDGQPKKKRAPFRTAHGRRLVEEYWQSVVQSRVERPLYHTYSDRYGGTRGIPFAARTHSGTALLQGTTRCDFAAAPNAETLFALCMESSEAAMRSGNVEEAESCLRQALTQLQNSDGGLTVAALASTARGSSASPAGQKRATDTGEVLCRLGKVALLCGNPSEALTFLNWSADADPLTTETYVLRAACHERLMEPQRAFDEYEKHMKLVPPSLEVLAQCGKCAAEAHNAAAATKYLHQLLALVADTRKQQQQQQGGADEATTAFYEAHANFYLGIVQQQLDDAEAEEQTCGSGRPHCGNSYETSETVRVYFDAAVANATYVQSYETSVNEATQRGDYALALHQLQCLQRMAPECADYLLHAAHVCHLRGDVAGEIDALSEALDRHQGSSARRTTLLTRGTVYADKVGDLGRAIKDFTLVVGLPVDDDMDRCTPIAFLKRADTLRHRASQGGAYIREDREAALQDYKRFLRALSSSSKVADASMYGCHEDTVAGVRLAAAGTFAEEEICHADVVAEVLLVLANGAFLKHDYGEATHYFSRAIARGWQPERPRPFCAPPAEVVEEVPAAAGAAGEVGDAAIPCSLGENLYDQVCLSLAHHVMALYPAQEDVFRVPYEPRDWVGVAAAAAAAAAGGASATSAAAAGTASGEAPAPATTTSGRKAAGGLAKAAERKDAERAAATATPSLSYQLVDARYAALRALEPCVFSELEEALVVAWGPYRAEVERVREDALATKGGKRSKRHVQ